MLAFFLILLFLPLLAALVGFLFLHGVTLKEFLLLCLVSLLVAGGSAALVSWARTYDKEVWNGVITSKSRELVSCEHSYKCRCHEECSTDSNGKRSCHEECDTCYDHTNDWDWVVYTSNGESFTISRVDRQGNQEPPRFTAISMGEPTALTHSYTNYIKGAPEVFFRNQSPPPEYEESLPEYPIEVYDYYHLDRVVTVGLTLPESRAWNDDLSRINAKLGKLKEVNMVIVFVRDFPSDYFAALEEHWLGGKKNDVVLVMGVDSSMTLHWVDVMAWTTNESFKAGLRDAISALPSLSRDEVIATLSRVVQESYQRKPMKDFEYLRSVMKPSLLQWFLTLLVGFACTGAMLWYFEHNNVFHGDDGKPARRRLLLQWVRQKLKRRKPGDDL